MILSFILAIIFVVLIIALLPFLLVGILYIGGVLINFYEKYK